MKRSDKSSTIHRALLIFLVMIQISAHAQTAFTYQGRLTTGGQPAQGAHDVEFRLFDAATDGNQVGATLTENGLVVTDGVFSAVLDFGDGPFNSAPRWIQVDVRASGGGAFTTLLPRLQIGAAPFAIESQFVAPGAVDTAALQDGAVTEAKIADEAVVLGKLATGSVTSSAILNDQISSVDIANGSIERIDLADDLIDSSKIAEGSVTGADIQDDSITSDDIDGSVYARKGQVDVQTMTASIGFGIQRVSVSCALPRDLLIHHVCNVPSDTSDLTILSERLTNIDNDVNPARLRCTAENRDPANAETLTATVWCLSVP